MATYTLSGSGIQTLTAGCTQLAVTVTVHGSREQVGQANPQNWYGNGLLRFGNANGYYPASPIDATNQLIDVPTSADRVGYALIGGCTVSAVELFTVVAPTTSAVNIPQETTISDAAWCSIGTLLAARAFATIQSAALGITAIHLLPFRIFQTTSFANVMWENGSTVGANLDIGVYSSGGTRLASIGSTSQGTLSSVATAAIGPVSLSPGNYWLAFAMGNNTGTVQQLALTASRKRQLGFRQATYAFPLPSSVTLAAAASANWPNIQLTADPNP